MAVVHVNSVLQFSVQLMMVIKQQLAVVHEPRVGELDEVWRDGLSLQDDFDKVTLVLLLFHFDFQILGGLAKFWQCLGLQRGLIKLLLIVGL